MNILSNISSYSIAINRAMLPANWLVSYPRSGNSFIRALLANYFSGLDRALNLAEISDSTLGEHDEHLWLELTGKTPAERSLEEEVCMRLPYLDRIRRMANPLMPLIKSHTLCADIAGHRAFAFVPGDRVIHLVRHPCDVAISFAHFHSMELDEAIDKMLRSGTFFHGLPDLGYEVIGSWAEHTRSWMGSAGVPVQLVRYCDLIGQPVETLQDMVAFLGFEPDPERARMAVEFASFKRLRQEEQSQGFIEKSRCSSKPYFREGRPGQWFEKLTIEQAMRIMDADPELIDRLGFSRLALVQNTGS